MSWKNETQERYQKSEKGKTTKQRWYEANKEERIKYQAEWRHRNRERRLIIDARARAKKKEIEFDLELADVAIPERCPVLGIPLVFGEGAGGHRDGSPSLDRINNSKGYVKGNVRVISHRANSIKRDATLEELEAVARYMREHCES